MKRPVSSPDGAVSPSVPDAGKLLRGCEHLWAMLTDDKWDDGSFRERATLLLLCDGGIVKLWLNDKALARSAWVSGTSLEEALCTLEAGLYDDTVGWRASANTKPRKK